MSIPVYKAPIKRKEMDSVLTSLVNENIGPGPYSKKLTHEAAKYVGAAGGTAFREYNRAIHTVFECLDLEKGAAVILSPLAPAVYIDCLNAFDLQPIFADLEEGEAVVSVRNVEKLVEQFDPKALILHSTLGFVPDLEAFSSLGIPLIEDISEGLGATNGVYKCGSFGSFTIIALEYESILTAGGGALLLGKGRKELQLIKNKSGDLGSNVLLPDMNAALALTLLEAHEKNIQRRKEIAEVYSKACGKTRHQQFAQGGERENIHFSYPVLLNSGLNDAVKYAMKKGITTVPAFESSALNCFQFEKTPCPTAQSLLLRCLLFPLYPNLGSKNIELISRVISTLP